MRTVEKPSSRPAPQPPQQRRRAVRRPPSYTVWGERPREPCGGGTERGASPSAASPFRAPCMPRGAYTLPTCSAAATPTTLSFATAANAASNYKSHRPERPEVRVRCFLRERHMGPTEAVQVRPLRFRLWPFLAAGTEASRPAGTSPSPPDPVRRASRSSHRCRGAQPSGPSGRSSALPSLCLTSVCSRTSACVTHSLLHGGPCWACGLGGKRPSPLPRNLGPSAATRRGNTQGCPCRARP